MRFLYFAVFILTSACSVNSKTNTPVPAQTSGSVIQYSIAQCPVLEGGFYRPENRDQVMISKSGTTLNVSDRGVNFQVDGQQHQLDGGNIYVGTCFQNTIAIHIKSQIDDTTSDLMLLYMPSKMSKKGLDRGEFENGKPADMSSYLPLVES